MGNSNSGGGRHHGHSHPPQPSPESEAPSTSTSAQPPAFTPAPQANPNSHHAAPHRPPPGYPGFHSSPTGPAAQLPDGASGSNAGPSGSHDHPAQGGANQPGGSPATVAGQRPNGAENNGSWFGGNGFTPYRIPPGIGCQALAQSTESQKTATIRNDVNLKRGTLKLVRDEANPGMHLVTFAFDATLPGSVCIFFLAKEGSSCSFKSIKPDLHTPVRVPFAAGLAQTFLQPSGTGVNLQNFDENELSKAGEGGVFPLVVRSQTIPKNPPPNALDISNDPPGAKLPKWVQSQMTLAVVERHAGDEFTVKVVKQKISVNGQRYELQEIYGIEQSGSEGTESASDIGKECVICMSEPRDTTVLPCRHMCMCRECAGVLRFQTNRCPICRQPVERLLEIRVPKDSKEKEKERAKERDVEQEKEAEKTEKENEASGSNSSKGATSSGSGGSNSNQSQDPTPSIQVEQGEKQQQEQPLEPPLRQVPQDLPEAGGEHGKSSTSATGTSSDGIGTSADGTGTSGAGSGTSGSDQTGV
eukprot:TRINITY_DN22157_c0_g1_i3.p1 TRINITY_DN22157_c0_g1~~TRINITY_DN22157_c0_g1_i3.p1  ORF type:complete len:529 (+),score=110.86 TRINITY_DN22157_c0_g1_i3:411-1997(+)